MSLCYLNITWIILIIVYLNLAEQANIVNLCCIGCCGAKQFLSHSLLSAADEVLSILIRISRAAHFCTNAHANVLLG